MPPSVRSVSLVELAAPEVGTTLLDHLGTMAEARLASVRQLGETQGAPVELLGVFGGPEVRRGGASLPLAQAAEAHRTALDRVLA